MLKNNKIEFLNVGFACDMVRQDAYGQWMMIGILNPVTYINKFPANIGKYFNAVANINCDEKFSQIIDARLINENDTVISECFNEVSFDGCNNGMIIPLCYLNAELQKPQKIKLQIKLSEQPEWQQIQTFEFRQYEENKV